MSVKVMGRVWDADLPPNMKLVLLAYADAAEHDGTDIWPGWERISTMTGYSQPTVARLTAELKTIGVLVQVGKGHTGQRASYLIDLEHPSLRAYQDDIQSESESLSPETESVSNDAESLSPVIPLPSLTPVLTSHPKKKRAPDFLWEAFVEVHGTPATESERGKYNAIVGKLREAQVEPDEYGLLCQGWKAKHGLEPGPATVANRVGEIRHFIAKGPIVAPTPRDVAQATERAKAQAMMDTPRPISDARRKAQARR